MMETEYKSILEKVINFTIERLGKPNEQLSENTKIEDDFGIAGLDTMTFYNDFFIEFKIKNTEDFNLDKYMTPEVIQFGLIFKSIFSKSAKEKLKVESVSLGHLAKVAMNKKWIEKE